MENLNFLSQKTPFLNATNLTGSFDNYAVFLLQNSMAKNTINFNLNFYLYNTFCNKKYNLIKIKNITKDKK
ncbi:MULTISPECIES: hypothetical protein [Campylobacter]|uniref:hypothetical protein n=1 Tax=Campylobacter TaxID=194 RepID=UPI0023F4B74D|nr:MULTISPECIES: hypothetical protein [Campylobacter]MCI6642029.1 hypothetical protein [Campylobacter sp.]MDD7422831.1 hypothetical protein [Campylobacter hominis]MDY3117870.1 hypothetical protein [Campylobacter hominis]